MGERKHRTMKILKKIYVYLFKKPNIKIGEDLNYYKNNCSGLYFEWNYGLWFIELDGGGSISHGLYKFYNEIE